MCGQEQRSDPQASCGLLMWIASLEGGRRVRIDRKKMSVWPGKGYVDASPEVVLLMKVIVK